MVEVTEFEVTRDFTPRSKVKPQLDQSDTNQRNFVTSAVTKIDVQPDSDSSQRHCGASGVVTIDVPPCGQFYEVPLDDDAHYTHPAQFVPIGRSRDVPMPMPMPGQVCGMTKYSYDGSLAPGVYTGSAASEVEPCMIALEPQPCAMTPSRHCALTPSRHLYTPCNVTQGGHHCHVECGRQHCGSVPNVQPSVAPMERSSVELIRNSQSFGVALNDDCCGLPRRMHEVSTTHPGVITERFPYGTTLASLPFHAVPERNQVARDCMQRCSAPPEVTTFLLGPPEDRCVPALEGRVYMAPLNTREFEGTAEPRDFVPERGPCAVTPDVQRGDESAGMGYYWEAPGGVATPRTMYSDAARPRKPCVAATNCHMCCTAHRSQPIGNGPDVEASGFMMDVEQLRTPPHGRVADGPPIDAPSNCEACMRLAEQHWDSNTVNPTFRTTRDVPSCEITRELPAYQDACDLPLCKTQRYTPSCELMSDDPFIRNSRELPSCEITCETAPDRKQLWMTSDRRSAAAVRSGHSRKITRDQTFRIWRHRNTRDLSRGFQRNTVSRNGHPFETTRDNGKLCAMSRDWKRRGPFQGEAIGETEMRDGKPVMMLLKSKSRGIHEDSAPHTASLRTEMQWDYYIPGLPDNVTEDAEGFISRNQEDSPKPVAVPLPRPVIESPTAPPVEIPVTRRTIMTSELTAPATWSRLFVSATRKAFQVVRQVVQLIAPVARQVVRQALPPPAALHHMASVGSLRMPLVPRLGRSALCRRCLRQQMTTGSENLDDPPRLTSSSFLDRYYSGESSHVSQLSDGLRDRIRSLENSCALATAFPLSRPSPVPVLEKSLSDSVLLRRRVCCPRHGTGSPGTSYSGSRLRVATSLSAPEDDSPATTDDDREWDDASSNTYTTARPSADVDDGSQLSGSHLLSPWHNLDQYSLVFVDAADDVVGSAGSGDGCSLGDVGSLESTCDRSNTLSSSPTPTDQPSLNSDDSWRRSDLSDDDLDDIVDRAHDVVDATDSAGHAGVQEVSLSLRCDVTAGKPEDSNASDDHRVKSDGDKGAM